MQNAVERKQHDAKNGKKETRVVENAGRHELCSMKGSCGVGKKSASGARIGQNH